MLTKAPRGTKDILPSETRTWQCIESQIRQLCDIYGFFEIRTPTFEHTELVQRGVGETTDIVQKEMYTFLDRSNRSITLKPEGTAPAVRAFIENGLYNDAQPTKLFYITPVFRYEKPQAGRLREHHQFGIEEFGDKEPSADAEVISTAVELFKKLGIKNLAININSIGCPVCRKKYNAVLKGYLELKKDSLCETCKERLERNPLRILDCKIDRDKDVLKKAPIILDYLCDECRDHFEKLKVYLDILGYEYKVNPMIVRGLDYYTKTVFEIIYNGKTVSETICGGGRYDGLIEECGGPSMPAVGFGMGIERLIMVLSEEGILHPSEYSFDIYIASIGDDAEMKAFKIISDLRRNGISAEGNHMKRSIKAQMKYANKINAKYTAVIGDNEIKSGYTKIKNMKDGTFEEIKISDIVPYLKNLL
ncbi:MAG TPA: histidine--tRNA ligase [Clostridiaceae bacterium]|nr:histidine--tRNA ligase [Clostridiaceae bacterium]